MKKIILLMLALFMKSEISHSMQAYAYDSCMYVKVPESKVLIERFNELLLGHFCSKSGIAKQLAGNKLHVLIVLGEVNKALYEYAKADPQNVFVNELKLDILEIILGDSPQALEQLKNIVSRIEQDRNSRNYAKIKNLKRRITNL